MKITCEDAYTANENYDHIYLESLKLEGRKPRRSSKRIPWQDIQYTSRSGEPVDEELREKLQTAYIKWIPVCVKVDGLNVMDDVGGLYGFEEFLRTINSDDPDDEEEKASSKLWARGMGWTGRKTKPENIL